MAGQVVIDEFEQDDRDRVLAPHRVRRFYLFFAPLVVSFLLCGTGGWLSYDADDVPPPAVALFAAGGVLFVAYLVFETFYLPVYPARCYLGWLRAKIDARPDAVVSADDPAAFFVQHIPRKNWTMNVGENATDLGLLRIDYARGELRFEGDRERWVVPADAVVSFKLEWFTPPMGNELLNRFTVVMLRIELGPDDILLTPLAAQACHWRMWTAGRRERAASALRKAIGHLVDPDEWDRPDDDELMPLVPPPR